MHLWWSSAARSSAKQSLGLATVAQAHTGAVSVIQRGDSGPRLNVHFHVLALDGVYVREEPSAPLVFHPLPAPNVDEVTRRARPSWCSARPTNGMEPDSSPFVT
jgi:hypothetical protein